MSDKPLTILRPTKLFDPVTGITRLTLAPLVWTRYGVIDLNNLPETLGASDD